MQRERCATLYLIATTVSLIAWYDVRNVEGVILYLYIPHV